MSGVVRQLSRAVDRGVDARAAAAVRVACVLEMHVPCAALSFVFEICEACVLEMHAPCAAVSLVFEIRGWCLCH